MVPGSSTETGAVVSLKVKTVITIYLHDKVPDRFRLTALTAKQVRDIVREELGNRF
jgi:hypothetical protein